MDTVDVDVDSIFPIYSTGHGLIDPCMDGNVGSEHGYVGIFPHSNRLRHYDCIPCTGEKNSVVGYTSFISERVPLNWLKFVKYKPVSI